MVRSKGLMQIIVGLILIIVSYLTHLKSSFFFISVGILFLAYGGFKLILWKIFSEKKPKEKEESEELKPEHIDAFRKNQGPTHSHHPTVIACHTCDTKHYSNANYCQMCGARLK